MQKHWYQPFICSPQNRGQSNKLHLVHEPPLRKTRNATVVQNRCPLCWDSLYPPDTPSKKKPSRVEKHLHPACQWNTGCLLGPNEDNPLIVAKHSFYMCIGILFSMCHGPSWLFDRSAPMWKKKPKTPIVLSRTPMQWNKCRNRQNWTPIREFKQPHLQQRDTEFCAWYIFHCNPNVKKARRIDHLHLEVYPSVVANEHIYMSSNYVYTRRKRIKGCDLVKVA